MTRAVKPQTQDGEVFYPIAETISGYGLCDGCDLSRNVEGSFLACAAEFACDADSHVIWIGGLRGAAKYAIEQGEKK